MTTQDDEIHFQYAEDGSPKWDDSVREMYHFEVVRLSPSAQGVPSMFTPDHKWFYVNSLDIDLETDDFDQVKTIYSMMADRVHDMAERMDYSTVTRLWDDFVAMFELYRQFDPDARFSIECSAEAEFERLIRGGDLVKDDFEV